MPDTYFTAAPHWTWYIVFYFFIGGIAGTSAVNHNVEGRCSSIASGLLRGCRSTTTRQLD